MDLTAAQRKALDSFVAECRAMSECRDKHKREMAKLSKRRLEKFGRCVDLDVPSRVLVEKSGLDRSRIYQLKDQLKEST